LVRRAYGIIARAGFEAGDKYYSLCLGCSLERQQLQSKCKISYKKDRYNTWNVTTPSNLPSGYPISTHWVTVRLLPVWHRRHPPPTLPPHGFLTLQVSESPVFEYPILPLHYLRLVFPVLWPPFIYHSSSLPAPPSKLPVSNQSSSQSCSLYSWYPVLLGFHYSIASHRYPSIHLGTWVVDSLEVAYLVRTV
jgi:hypothetical protein